MKEKELIKHYLESNGFNETKPLMEKFESFKELLAEENQKINLVSRKQTEKDFWLKNIFDSLLLIEVRRLQNEKVLDFGTGGGLPGIPLNIIFPDSEFFLLDSRKKKMESVDTMINKLKLYKALTICCRIEEIDIDKYSGFYDLVLSRSVKITDEYAQIMLKLIKKNGALLLYKGIKTDDIITFEKRDDCRVKIHNVSKDEIGTRKIVEIIKL